MTNPDFISYEINPAVKSSIEEPTKPIQITIYKSPHKLSDNVYFFELSIVRPVKIIGEYKNLKSTFEIKISTKEGLVLDFPTESSVAILSKIIQEIAGTSAEHSVKIYGSAKLQILPAVCEQSAYAFLILKSKQFVIPFR